MRVEPHGRAKVGYRLARPTGGGECCAQVGVAQGVARIERDRFLHFGDGHDGTVRQGDRQSLTVDPQKNSGSLMRECRRALLCLFKVVACPVAALTLSESYRVVPVPL